MKRVPLLVHLSFLLLGALGLSLVPNGRYLASPFLFPSVCLLLIVLFAAVEACLSFQARVGAKYTYQITAPRSFGIAIGSAVGMLIVVPFVGLIGGGAFLIGVLSAALGARPFWKIGLVCLSWIGLSYVLFVQVLKVPLPHGMFFS